MSEIHPKTAVITLHPYLPPESEQIDGARDWGLPELQNGGDGKRRLDIWFDDVRNVKTTNWSTALKQRDVLMRTYRGKKAPNDQVFFARPICVGWSKKLATEMVEVIHSAEALIYVHDMRREFRPSDEMAEFWETHRRQIKAAEMRKHRSKN